jgi:hypothetical protein
MGAIAIGNIEYCIATIRRHCGAAQPRIAVKQGRLGVSVVPDRQCPFGNAL